MKETVVRFVWLLFFLHACSVQASIKHVSTPVFALLFSEGLMILILGYIIDVSF